MKTTKLNLKEMQGGKNPLINAVWIQASKEEEAKVWQILSELKIKRE